MNKFVFKIEYIYDDKSVIPKSLDDYSVVDETKDLEDMVITLKDNVLTLNGIQYLELTESSPFYSKVPKGGRYFHTDDIGMGGAWSLYDNGYAKYEVYGSNRPVIDSFIGKLFPV